jgi:hypothetical protein
MKNLRKILFKGAVLCVLTLLRTNVQAQSPTTAADQNDVTAIDILLEPDATMVRHAEAVNARLRSVFPKGFALDASHHPHISMFQCFVPTGKLNEVYAAAGKVLAGGNVTAIKLEAFK